jgi:hypothetical protein
MWRAIFSDKISSVAFFGFDFSLAVLIAALTDSAM